MDTSRRLPLVAANILNLPPFLTGNYYFGRVNGGGDESNLHRSVRSALSWSALGIHGDN